MSVITVYMDQRGAPLRREGKWSCGPCPICGGDDRFRVVYDEDKGREFYSCRQCDRHGDDVQFLRDFVGMSYPQAQQEAERLRGAVATKVRTVEDKDLWHEACMDFINWANRRLMRSDRALARLERERGILPATARRFALGYNCKDAWVSRPSFGLSDQERPDGRTYDLCLPAGLVIPVHAGGILYGVQVRRRQVYRGERYATVPGSRLVPMLLEGAEDGAVVVVVESYLCGALVWQELGGEATVLALGSVAVRPDDDLQKLLAGARVILIALDSDAAGAEQAKVWLERYPNAVRCPVPPRVGKDPTEGHLNGLDLRAWYAAGCALAETSAGDDTAGQHATCHADVLSIGSAAARLRVVSDRDSARRAVARILHDCPAIAVAIRVVPTVTHVHAGYHPRLSRLSRCAVYAPARGRVYVFDMEQVRRADLAPLWGLTVVAHDGVRLMRHFKHLRDGGNRVASTMLMANGLLNRNVGLRDALELATDTPPPVWPEGDRGLALRALALPQCFGALFRQFGPEAQPDAVSVLAAAQRAIACLEVDGAPFDAEGHSALVAAWERELAEHAALLPEDLDPAKHREVRRWVKGAVPAERRAAWKSTSSGTLSTRDGNLALVDDIPEIHALREHRRVAKLLNTYGRSFAACINPATGRLHARWDLGGCATGRVSCSDPNLLALPRDPAFRALFRAPEGRRLLVADVSQIQLRIAAHIAGDEAMLDAYARGLDLHNGTAAALTGKTIKEVTKEERCLAKACNFGLLFGQGERGFRDYANANYGLTLTFRQAERVRTTWLRAYPGVADWHRRTKRALERGRRVYTEGRRTGGAEDFRGNALQQALAFQVQGTEAEIMMRALSRLLPALREHGGLLALFVHDEVVLEVSEDDTAVAAVADAVAKAVADAFLHYFPDASTDGLVEVRAVQTWADAK